MPPVLVSNNPEKHTKRLPGGHYDENLVCLDCEKRFGLGDDYAAEFFHNSFRKDGQPFPAPATGDVMAFQYANVDYQRLKMFAMSLLWRASATAIQFFERVTTGPHQDQLRRMILTGDPGSPDQYSMFVTRWVSRPEHVALTQTQISPYRARLDGINEVKFLFAGATMHVKVDKRPYREPFPELILRPNSPLNVVVMELEGSKDVIAIRPGLEALAARLRQRRTTRG
jgi:hypothetical protein